MTTTELQTVDAPVGPATPHVTTDPDFTQVVLQLRERVVTFDAVCASTVPDLSDPTHRPDFEVYLTRRFNVVWHDQHRRTMSVYTIDEFVAHFSDTPISWVIDEVLAAMPMPVEQLDI